MAPIHQAHHEPAPEARMECPKPAQRALCAPLCLSPFSVRKVGPMIAVLLYPGHEFQGVLKGQRAVG